MDRLAEFFSPEKTAQRILDFALARYAPEGEDTEEARRAFADTIGGAIQKGFDEAQSILGELEESIQQGIDRTHELVFDGLADFVASGLPEDHAERSEAIETYAQLFREEVHLEVTTERVQTYGGHGEIVAGSPAAADGSFEAQA